MSGQKMKTRAQWDEKDQDLVDELVKSNEMDDDGWIICGSDINYTFLRIADKNRHVNRKALLFAKQVIYVFDHMQGRTLIDVPRIRVTKGGLPELLFKGDDCSSVMLIVEDISNEDGRHVPGT